MPESPGWGYTISDTPSARLSSVYIAISELDMFIWWHELSMLLIHQCISAIADNLIYPQISLALFLHDLMTVSYFWWNNKSKEANITILWYLMGTIIYLFIIIMWSPWVCSRLLFTRLRTEKLKDSVLNSWMYHHWTW